jgi:hypothetical protein
MLDVLEGELVELRAKNEELLASAKAEKPVRSASRKSRRSKSKGKSKRTQRTAKHIAPRERRPKEPTEGQEVRQVGKRQALGKSLMQLRRAVPADVPSDAQQ